MKADRVPETNGKLATAELRPRRLPPADGMSGIVLALGGGFSRGFAHLGVLEVLEQAQIPISAIVGTSIGALLGAAYADGISLRELCDLGRRVHLRDFLRFHPSAPRASARASSAQRKDCIGQFVQKWFRATQLEELPIPTAIVTTDLETGAPYIFSRGPIEVAIRASCAFPGLVKPVEYDGHVLGDGCIVAPVPSAIAASLNGGCVLAVSVSPDAAIAARLGNRMEHRMEDRLEDRTNDSSSAFLVSRKRLLEPSWRKEADVLIEPDLRHIEWNDFSLVEEAFSAGAEAMRRALPSLRERISRQSTLAPAPRMPFGAESGLAI
jgi:NTE family protein